jgi:hypothetical protein
MLNCIHFAYEHRVLSLNQNWILDGLEFKHVRLQLIPGDHAGLFKLAIQLRTFFYSAIYNTATGYVLWVYLTDI